MWDRYTNYSIFKTYGILGKPKQSYYELDDEPHNKLAERQLYFIYEFFTFGLYAFNKYKFKLSRNF